MTTKAKKFWYVVVTNIWLNLKMDSYNGKSEAKNISKISNTLMHEMGIEDIWI